jgi:N-acetyl-beta-hexosaminidase
MKAEGLKGVQALQGAFSCQLVGLLSEKGRRAVCWDETSQGVRLPQGAVGMSWRGTDDGIAAAKAGHDVIMTPHFFCYYDYPQGLANDPCDYPHWGAGPDPITLAQAYRFDPCAGVPSACRIRVLGGQCANWTEQTRTPEELEWKIWPRACALAEALWTAPADRDFAAFRKRLAVHRGRLLAAGVNAAGLDGMENEQDLIVYGGTPSGIAAAVQEWMSAGRQKLATFVAKNAFTLMWSTLVVTSISRSDSRLS